MREINIAIKSHFDSAHYLVDYDGDCGNLHGHRFSYEVSLKVAINEHSGMGIDFKALKKECRERVEKVLDHQTINCTIEQPTAENICYWIFEILIEKYPELQQVTVWESPECSVSLCRSQFSK